VIQWLFYVFYILRRSALIICYLFTSDGILQLSISISFSLAVIFKQIPIYISFTRCFRESLYNAYHFCNELLLALFHVTILIGLVHHSPGSSKTISDICIIYITVAWVMNMAVSITILVKDAIGKIRTWLRRRREETVSKFYKTKTVPELNDNKFIKETEQT
jgi:hypothetical protein